MYRIGPCRWERCVTEETFFINIFGVNAPKGSYAPFRPTSMILTQKVSKRTLGTLGTKVDPMPIGVIIGWKGHTRKSGPPHLWRGSEGFPCVSDFSKVLLFTKIYKIYGYIPQYLTNLLIYCSLFLVQKYRSTIYTGNQVGFLTAFPCNTGYTVDDMLTLWWQNWWHK